MQKKKYYLNIIFMLVLLGLVFYTILKEEDTSSILDALMPVFSLCSGQQ